MLPPTNYTRIGATHYLTVDVDWSPSIFDDDIYDDITFYDTTGDITNHGPIDQNREYQYRTVAIRTILLVSN
jgi:hypothetical protein